MITFAATEPATLISTLLLQTHARQLYSLALFRFCSIIRVHGMQITQCYHGHQAYLGHGSRETQVQQQRRPIQNVVSCSLFMSRLNHFHHERTQLYCYKPRSKHRAITLKSEQQFSSGPKIFHLPQEPNMNNTLTKNHPQSATRYNLVQLCHICINREALSIVLLRISCLRLLLVMIITRC